jgi:3D (Asp-Asp-Asp) domain-containing protein
MFKIYHCIVLLLLFSLGNNNTEIIEKNQNKDLIEEHEKAQSFEQIFENSKLVSWKEYLEAPKIHFPMVKILSPFQMDYMENPVTITIASFHISSYQVFDNGQLVGRFMAQKQNQNIFHSIFSMDEIHNIEVLGYDREGNFVSYDEVDFIPMYSIDTHKGDLLGRMWITYYYLSQEEEYTGKKDHLLYDENCTPLAKVSYDFASAVCIEGSGKLMEGTVINYSKSCKCGVPCFFGGVVCYSDLKKEKFPWGKGSRSNPLIPFRSVAVDNNMIPHGSVLYIEEWDGVFIPYVGNIGGFIHDGCFKADDVGGAVKNDHFDFFAGTKEMWLNLEKLFPSRTNFTVFLDGGRCDYLKNKEKLNK